MFVGDRIKCYCKMVTKIRFILKDLLKSKISCKINIDRRTVNSEPPIEFAGPGARLYLGPPTTSIFSNKKTKKSQKVFQSVENVSKQDP